MGAGPVRKPLTPFARNLLTLQAECVKYPRSMIWMPEGA